MKILLADDHAFVRKGLYTIIEEAYPKASIEEVTNGTDVLKNVIKHKYDIIISDITMPDMNGIEVLHSLKEQGIKTPVIILSVHTAEIYAIRCFKEGAYAYLNKDSTPKTLVEAINHILTTNQKYITPEVAILLADIVGNENSGPLHDKLSNREFEILKLIVVGKAGTEIAEMLHLSTGSVSTFRNRILTKLNLETNADLIKYAMENDIN